MGTKTVLTSEEQRKKWRAAYQRKKEKAVARQRAYRLIHQEQTRDAGRKRDKRRYDANPDKYRIKRRKQYQDDKASYYEYQKAYRALHPDKVRVWHSKRYVKKKHVAISDLTAAQWSEIKLVHGNRCAYCGKKLTPRQITLDHITPISKGGNHTRTNVVPACKSCNSRKGNREVLRPVQPVLLTVA
jgi:5-methylcytosine-specific restriction endonuclease McrA